jgi:hypothetical protein
MINTPDYHVGLHRRQNDRDDLALRRLTSIDQRYRLNRGIIALAHIVGPATLRARVGTCWNCGLACHARGILALVVCNSADVGTC